MNDVLRAHVAVVIAAVLFGSTFVVVKDATESAGPIPFLAVRFLAGALVLAPFAKRERTPGLGWAGLWCGVALLAGYVLQTVGVQYTSSSVSAFLTYLLVVIVPVISSVTARRLPDGGVIAGVALATAGLVAMTGGVDAIGRGEVLTIGCALAFAVHVVLLSAWSPRFDVTTLNVLQLLVVGTACLVVGFFTGGYGFSLEAWLGALFTGVAVSAGALWLQMWGQQRVSASRTSLLLMIEPVAAAFLGVAAGEALGLRGVLGAGLILAGIVVAELPVARRLAAARS